MKLAVIGSINTDMTVDAERIPLKGETLRGDHIQYIPGGKGANQAVAMARLGADVEMFGCVGNDANGELMIKNLRQNQVKTEHIKILDGIHTGVALITIGENDNTIIVVPGANKEVSLLYFEEIKKYLESFDMVVLQQEIPLETVYAVIEFCYEKSIPVILNPAPASNVPMDVINKLTFLTPNEHEAIRIFGEKLSTEQLLRKYPEKLVITQGEKGVSVCLKDGEVVTIPARKTKVADTTGAGDTLNGAFAVRMAFGDNLTDALKYANIAASLSTEKFGAQGGMPSHREVIKELEKASEK